MLLIEAAPNAIKVKTFSHDFIGLAMVDHLITEMGEIARPAK